MVGEPRDRTAYSIAIAGLGIGLAILLAGICWIAVQDSGPNVTEVFTHRCALQVPIRCQPALYVHSAASIPDGLWVALAAIGGVLIGTLIPCSPRALRTDSEQPRGESNVWKWDLPSIAAIAAAAVIATFVVLSWADPLILFVIAGLLLGLLIPSPARRD